jgi:hypothetical protein
MIKFLHNLAAFLVEKSKFSPLFWRKYFKNYNIGPRSSTLTFPMTRFSTPDMSSTRRRIDTKQGSKKISCPGSRAGLPDGLFSNQKSQFG